MLQIAAGTISGFRSIIVITSSLIATSFASLVITTSHTTLPALFFMMPSLYHHSQFPAPWFISLFNPEVQDFNFRHQALPEKQYDAQGSAHYLLGKRQGRNIKIAERFNYLNIISPLL
ncbi:hypothetical protein [Siccibacter colletis]|uniref:hypothetical protein n=1 Tax=Siccibacter colletis TaxID=1505757 RepID=UPI003CF32567